MEMKAGLACQKLDFAWPGKQTTQGKVLTAVTADFPPGSVYLITGATGAGKSTLLHLLAGLLRPTAGEVLADGRPISRWTASHRDCWRRQAGIVFQHLALVPDISAAENLLLALLPRGIPWSRMQAHIRSQLAAADLEDLSGIPAAELSGGQRQRLAIARALVAGPHFILADEPTAFQDDAHAEDIIGQLQGAAENGAVVVICSQDPRMKSSKAVHRRYHLTSGRLASVPGQQGLL